jgi:phage baseplate assembly protein W
MYPDFPYHVSGAGRTATTDRREHVRDLVEQLLFTHPGERVNRPEFGSGLLQLVFAPASPELAASLQFTVQASLQQVLADWIEVHGVQVEVEDSTLRVRVQYRLLDEDEAQTEEFSREV